MPQGSSSHGISANVDLSHQSGVMAVLAAVRASAIAPAQKSELRDLVFEFTNGGRDESVRLQLEQKLAAYGVSVAPLSARGTASTHATEFGAIRPAPSFAPVEYSPVPAVPPTSPVVPVTPSAPVIASPVVTPPPAATVVPPAAPAPLPPTPPSPPAQPVVPNPAPAPVTTPPATPVVPIPTPVPVPTSAPVDAEVEANLRRIREIKAAVNEQVGNPVNLVDIDNAVGREYMSALLEAMKKVNAGAAGVAAMQRLETAFVSVQAVLAARSATPAPSPVPSQRVPISEPVAPASAMTPAAPVPDVSVSQSAPVMPPAAPEVTPPTVDPVMPVPPTSAPPAVTPVMPPPAVAVVTPPPVAPLTTPPPAPQSTIIAPAVAPPPASVSVPPPIPSLADNPTKLKSPLNLPDPAVVSALGPNDDPLMTKEIDAGLEQLLLEWSLFKKSGLFGTGPKGREHPLFKKIAPLPIALLLAGRFEGATQEIKQSITDYMNGWRYEQGIVYEQGETFEKYLRRVIKHIVDLQKQRQTK